MMGVMLRHGRVFEHRLTGRVVAAYYGRGSARVR